MTDIEPLSALAYAAGEDPIGHACSIVALVMEVAESIREHRTIDPAWFSDHGPSDHDTYARRIVGALLNAGWKPPTEAEMVAAAVASVERQVWIASHKHEPCRCGHSLLDHVDRPGTRCTSCGDCWAWLPGVSGE